MEGTIVASYEFLHALRYVVAFDNGTEGVFFAQELMSIEPFEME
jgi:hypothetical protein